jgi:3,4-dihydroxy 2-butanone 4-phosphate synthase/GTP cyclohydrolase II
MMSRVLAEYPVSKTLIEEPPDAGADRTMFASEKYAATLALARKTMVPFRKEVVIREKGVMRKIAVTRLGVGPLDTPHGPFNHFYFEVEDRWRHYHVLINADIGEDFHPNFRNLDSLLVRIDSGCQTGQVYGDQTCECRYQLALAMTDLYIAHGNVIHIPAQDGRGMGLPFKLATLLVQEQLKIDTVEAARAVAEHMNIDVRSYGGAVAILKFFGIPEETPVRLMTNNPKKIIAFAENGYRITELVPVVIPPTEHTLPHLLAKQRDLGHLNLVKGPPQEETVQ